MVSLMSEALHGVAKGKGKARNRNLRYLSSTGPVRAQIVYVYPCMVIHV